MEFWDEYLRFVVLLFVKLAMCIQIKFKIWNKSSGMREPTKRFDTILSDWKIVITPKGKLN